MWFVAENRVGDGHGNERGASTYVHSHFVANEHGYVGASKVARRNEAGAAGDYYGHDDHRHDWRGSGSQGGSRTRS
jgi:hypothetical protein